MRTGKVLLVLLLAGAPALAAGRLPLDMLTARLGDLDARLREMEEGLRARPQEGSDVDRAQRRLTDAQVLYTLRNYDAAATILFDLVDRYSKTPSYPDALFYLADSLYQRRDYLAARRFFTRLVELSPQHPRYQEGLQRLVEIALHLQSFEQTDKWLDRLAQIPKDRMLASAPYVRGKYYFLQKDHDRAVQVLSAILPQSPYYFQARYLLGASRVARGQLPEALTDFLQIVQDNPRTDEEKRILELAHMAIGRIYYEQGQTTKAQESYLQVSQKSDLFPDALYEAAWVAIKAKEYRQALRQLELLVLAQPEALIIPEAKLLMGNLQIRIGDHEPATRWFERTRAEFQPVHRRLEELLQQKADPVGYLRDLVRKNLTKFDVALVVPKPADRWLRSDREVAHFSALAGDVSELRRALSEAEEAVQRLEKALNGPQRYNVDPLLSQARAGAVQLSGELLALRRQLAEALMGVLSVAASLEEVRQLGEFAKRRSELEKDVARVLASTGSRSRADQLRAQVNELDKRAAELLVHMEGLRKQRQAIENYYSQTKKQQKIPQEQFERELREVTEQESDAVRRHEQLRRDLQEALNQVGQEDLRLETDSQIQKGYAAVVQGERELLGKLVGRLSGAQRLQADRIWAAFERSFAIDQRLSSLLARVNQDLEKKLADAQATLLVEKENVRVYRQQLQGCTDDTEELGGGVLADALRRAARRFYDIVVRADIGIIDVAWAIKQQRTERISRLVREQKRELKLLDDEFKEVLKE